MQHLGAPRAADASTSNARPVGQWRGRWAAVGTAAQGRAGGREVGKGERGQGACRAGVARERRGGAARSCVSWSATSASEYL